MWSENIDRWFIKINPFLTPTGWLSFIEIKVFQKSLSIKNTFNQKISLKNFFIYDKYEKSILFYVDKHLATSCITKAHLKRLMSSFGFKHVNVEMHFRSAIKNLLELKQSSRTGLDEN